MPVQLSYITESPLTLQQFCSEQCEAWTVDVHMCDVQIISQHTEYPDLFLWFPSDPPGKLQDIISNETAVVVPISGFHHRMHGLTD